MANGVIAQPKLKKSKAEVSAERRGPTSGQPEVASTYGAPAGMPCFLSGVQRKLAVGAVDDPLEHEADRVAEQVMRIPDPAAKASLTASDTRFGHLAGHPTMSESAPAVQRKCSCGGSCEQCKAEEERMLQRKPAAPQISRAASSSSATETTAPPIVHEVLSSPGQPLDGVVRQSMESRFRRDFSGVRVHTDAKAAESAATVQARAYTAGHNIVLGRHETVNDLPVLAHELAHVVQQTGTTPVLQRLTYCTDFLEVVTPYVAEDSVRDSLAGDAAIFGKVETELSIPEGTAAGQRTEKEPRMIPPYTGADPGRVDVALLTGSTLEILEVKKATWGWDGATFAEGQLEKYLRKAGENTAGVTASWRAKRRGNRSDEIRSVTAMPMSRLSLQPNPRGIDGEPVSLRWCDDGIVVFKRRPPEEEEPKEKEPKDKDKQPGPSDTLPEQLLKLGEGLAKVLAADALLDVALGLASGLVAFVMSPLIALAAVVLGIVFFWDKLKSLGRKIAALANWVRDNVSWILGKIEWLGIKLAELGDWLADKIGWLADRLVEGIEWGADKVAAGAKWVGHKIASAAESAWDWLFGSGPEETAPNIDLPVTEDTTHCGMVAHEDTIIKIGADLLFDTAHWTIKPEGVPVLVAAAETVRSMLRNQDDRVTINGYTDNVGGVDYNQHLSEQRADAVRDWLVVYGIPASVIQTKGFGKSEAQFNDPEGRALDRRVEIWGPKHGSVERVCW